MAAAPRDAKAREPSFFEIDDADNWNGVPLPLRKRSRRASPRRNKGPSHVAAAFRAAAAATGDPTVLAALPSDGAIAEFYAGRPLPERSVLDDADVAARAGERAIRAAGARPASIYKADALAPTAPQRAAQRARDAHFQALWNAHDDADAELGSPTGAPPGTPAASARPALLPLLPPPPPSEDAMDAMAVARFSPHLWNDDERTPRLGDNDDDDDDVSASAPEPAAPLPGTQGAALAAAAARANAARIGATSAPVAPPRPPAPPTFDWGWWVACQRAMRAAAATRGVAAMGRQTQPDHPVGI